MTISNSGKYLASGQKTFSGFKADIIIWDLETMRATFDKPIVIGDEFAIKGLIPVENSKEYKMKIASYTEGRGMFVTKFYGYKEASAEFSKARKKTTYDPLNKKEYLLHKLNAIRD